MMHQASFVSPIRSCMDLARRVLSDDRPPIHKVSIDKLRAEGFTITIAPPARDKDMRALRRCGRPKNLPVNAVVDDIVKGYGYFPPFGAIRVAAEKAGFPVRAVASCLFNRRYNLGIRRMEEAS